jgi:hypothetical protein
MVVNKRVNAQGTENDDELVTCSDVDWLPARIYPGLVD